MDRLVVSGARQHNLRNVSVELPRGKLVVFTGPSGSGKSSLAFDTIYAEGQRRYVESLSAYARQFLEQLPKPDVDRIEGLSPAIAIEQRPLPRSPRSTVGTVTEIADYLRLLFARAGVPHCPKCGQRIEARTVQEIVDELLALDAGSRVSLLAPIVRGCAGDLESELDMLRRNGFVRVRVDGQIHDLGDDIELAESKKHDLDVVVDRLVIKDGIRSRLTDSVELSLETGSGRVLCAIGDDAPVVYSERFACVDCDVTLPPIEPRLFSFNGPHGACPSCDGLGYRDTVDPSRIVVDPELTLREGAMTAWGRRGSVALAMELDRAVKALGVDPDTRWSKLSDEMQDAILFGLASSDKPTKRTRRRTTPKTVYEGIVPRLQRRLEEGEDASSDDPDASEGAIAQDEIGRFVVTRACDACKGRRLRDEALAVRVGGKDIAEVSRMDLGSARAFISKLTGRAAKSGLQLSARQAAVTVPLVRAIDARLGFLIDVGIDYLTLDRSAQSLSSGEGQRIRLATQIGAALVGVLYVLDEPSVGLHARDNERLIEAQCRLRDLGNTVIVVEHDRDAILAADWVIDMGPGAGRHGGNIVAQGTPTDIAADDASVTGPYLSGKRSLPIPKSRRAPSKRAVRITGARAHNLKDVSVDFPIGLLTCVTGVSGSGKSSLVIDTLLQAARVSLYSAKSPVGECDRISGLDHVDKVVSIDQAPIGRTPRSNPATYTGVFSLLRELYASLPEARTRGYKAGRFSFNVKGGRCEACQGDGVLRIEMHFLPDIFVTCDSCSGRRYNRETLEITYHGLSIADALDLTVDAARDVFEALPRVRERLDAMASVGLGYLTLGQPASTLSGGEAQRVKLARELSRRATGQTLYVLDEPTTGLHFTDIESLMDALVGLRDQGNTIVVIEHNLDVVACADWVIDMGPEGGTRGGNVVCTGAPEAVAACEDSHTGRYLAPILGKPSRGGKKKRASA